MNEPIEVIHCGPLDANAPMPPPGSRVTRITIRDRETGRVYMDQEFDILVLDRRTPD